MAERTERTVLNNLIQTCRDAERGLRVAADHVTSQELKRLFLRLAEQRRSFADELLPHAQRLGGGCVNDGTAAAAVHRTWIHIKARLARNPDRAVLEEAARGERYAVHAYDDAVTDWIPPEAREIVEGQDLGVRAARSLVTGFIGPGPIQN
jgi:uncharacterized protein (TIGR02284 family)